MKFEMLYQSNLDYTKTIEKLARCKNVSGYPTEKGLFVLYFKGFHSKAVISPKGKVQVLYANEKEKQTILPLFKQLLVSEQDPLKFEPIKISGFSLSWPPPPNFKLSACKETFFYRMVQKLPLPQFKVDNRSQGHWFIPSKGTTSRRAMGFLVLFALSYFVADAIATFLINL